MSTRKARLIKPTNFNINQYYNIYSSKQTIIGSRQTKNYTVQTKKLNYFMTNNKSLQYSAIYKNNQNVGSKKWNKFTVYTDPLYMRNFLNKTSNINYFNTYDIYNYKLKGFKSLSIVRNLDPYQGFSENKINRPWLYNKQSRYFHSIYKHYYRHLYEHEDENKLIYRKHNMYKSFIVNAKYL